MIDKKQSLIIVREDVIFTVITSKEASEILGISDSYVRKLVIKGEFDDWEYRKTDKMLLFNKESIESRKGKFKENKKTK